MENGSNVSDMLHDEINIMFTDWSVTKDMVIKGTHPSSFLAQLTSCAITNHSSVCDCCCQHQWCQRQHRCRHWHCRQKLTSSSVPI